LPDPRPVAVASAGLARRGTLRVFVGSAAGTGKTFRMLTEAHQLRQAGVDVVVGLVESHGRPATEALVEGLEVIPRRRIDYRGVVLEEMDLPAVMARRPQVVLIDELPHTNVPGTGNHKRWQDVVALQDAGIDVITALNVQHLESLHDIIQQSLGVTVRETVPDWLVRSAQAVINLDISTTDLRQRLLDGKIYGPDKIAAALTNFFTVEHLDTLRELALREVADAVDSGRDNQGASGPSPGLASAGVDRLMVALASDYARTATLLRKASRIAGRLNRDWYAVYVEDPAKPAPPAGSSPHRALLDIAQLAQALGAEVVTLRARGIATALLDFAVANQVTLILAGQSAHGGLRHLVRGSLVQRLGSNRQGIDVLIVGMP
jgi:two-component system sensor histidine kinase KdpD